MGGGHIGGIDKVKIYIKNVKAGITLDEMTKLNPHKKNISNIILTLLTHIVLGLPLNDSATGRSQLTGRATERELG